MKNSIKSSYSVDCAILKLANIAIKISVLSQQTYFTYYSAVFFVLGIC